MPERRRVRQQRRLDRLARDEQLDRLDAGGPGRVDEVLPFRHEQAQLRAPAARGELADELQLLVVARGDHAALIMAPARTPSALTEVTRESAAVLASEAARTASDHLPVVARFR